jgi:hypothetical protein
MVSGDDERAVEEKVERFGRPDVVLRTVVLEARACLPNWPVRAEHVV